jgi:hypothetical protein
VDIYTFLAQFVALDIPSVVLVAGVVGTAVFLIIQAFDTLAKNRPPGGVGLNPQIKFWAAVVLSFVIPLGAYLLVTNNDHRPLTFGGVALAAGVAFMAATGIHWITGAGQEASAIHKAEKNPGTPVPLENPPSDKEVIVNK